jgi:hypothetical protein
MIMWWKGVFMNIDAQDGNADWNDFKDFAEGSWVE